MKKKHQKWALIAAAGGIGYLIYKRSVAQKVAAPAPVSGDYLYIGGPRQ